jgi:hypothetical protein
MRPVAGSAHQWKSDQQADAALHVCNVRDHQQILASGHWFGQQKTALMVQLNFALLTSQRRLSVNILRARL